MAKRLALLAAAGLSALALSGCHDLFEITFGIDPEVFEGHGSADDRSAGTAATGRAFRGRADGDLAGRMKITHGPVKSRTNRVRFVGRYRSTLTGPPQPGDEALAPFASAQWHGRFRGVRNRRTGRIALTGLVLATFDDPTAGRACLSLRNTGTRKQNRRPTKASRSNLTVLGGEGGARTLRGTAAVRVRLARDDTLRLRGRVKQRRGAARGLTPACAKLERRFGLTPLPD
jgi:hypothetical protein